MIYPKDQLIFCIDPLNNFILKHSSILKLITRYGRLVNGVFGEIMLQWKSGDSDISSVATPAIRSLRNA